jgi:hypothetical protein
LTFVINEATADLRHTGRILRNGFSHPKQQPVLPLGMAAPMVETSHRLIAEISETAAARPRQD